jgi:inosine/xanthosine triphosphatase
MKIIIGTKNAKKIETVSSIFREIMKTNDVEVVAHDADSKVPEAPHDQETYDGALNRATECSQLMDADFYVGLESGLVERYGNMFEEAWAVVIAGDGTKYVGYSSGLMLPPAVVSRMQNGEKHDEIMLSLDKQFDLPDDNRDTWSRYTGGNISRQVSLEEALRNALIQLVPSERNLYQIQ